LPDRGCLIGNVPATLVAENVRKVRLMPFFASAAKAAGTYWIPSVIALLAILLFIRLAGIWNTHESYTVRLAYVRGLLEKAKKLEGKKLVIGEDQADRQKLMMYWGLPFETLQISALESPDSMRVIAIAENADSLAARLPRDSMVSFLMIPHKAFRDLPQRFYRISDTLDWQDIRLE